MAKRISRETRDALISAQEKNKQKIVAFLGTKIPVTEVCEKLATEVIRGAEEGLEFSMSFDDWFEKRFKPSVVWLNKEDYLRALIRALWLAGNFAGSDFGGSRQRDMAQVWTDTARGFLGEIAVSSLLSRDFGIQTKIDTTRGAIEGYLPTDIAKITVAEEERATRIKVSIKTTKFNGRWLDSPGAQFARSDYFALVKIGISRQHFLAFLKSVGFMDSLLASGKELGEVTDKDIDLLTKEVPDFYPLPAYVAGFIGRKGLTLPVHFLNARIKGRKNKRIIVEQGVGLFTPAVVQDHLSATEPAAGSMLVEIDPIIKSFTGQKFLAHSGGLLWEKKDWDELTKQL